MNFSETKDYMLDIKARGNKIERNLERLNDLRESMTCIGSTCGDEWVQHSRDTDRISAIVSTILDLEKETDNLIDAYADRTERVKHLLDVYCNDNERDVINWIYFKRKSVSETAFIVGISTRHAKRLHKEALKKVAEMM